MLEVFEIRIDELERMLSKKTLSCVGFGYDKRERIETNVDIDGCAWMLVSYNMTFNNGFENKPGIVAVNTYDAIMQTAESLEPEVLDGFDGTLCYCYEIWKVREITADELYFEFGIEDDPSIEEEYAYQRAINLLENCDDIDSRAYRNAWETVIDYESRAASNWGNMLSRRSNEVARYPEDDLKALKELRLAGCVEKPNASTLFPYDENVPF